MANGENRPDLKAYHKSVTDELNTIKNRVRNLVKHWPTDGEWKESALRTVLRRHLPDSSTVGRGFIVSRNQSSTQIDLLVLKPEKPVLFRDGDLVLVTPNVPKVLVEVKTELRSENTWYKAALKLVQNSGICHTIADNKPWLRLFAYSGSRNQIQNIFNAVCRVYRETGIPINCITCGNDVFMRFWPKGEIEYGDPEKDRERLYWRAYDMPGYSKSYFIGNLVDAVCDVDRTETDYSWFVYKQGKREFLEEERTIENCQDEADPNSIVLTNSPEYQSGTIYHTAITKNVISLFWRLT